MTLHRTLGLVGAAEMGSPMRMLSSRQVGSGGLPIIQVMLVISFLERGGWVRVLVSIPDMGIMALGLVQAEQVHLAMDWD
jgi:hypothetical protein